MHCLKYRFGSFGIPSAENMVKDGIVGKAALLILTPGTFWRRCRGVDEQGPRRARGSRFATPQARAGRWPISVVWRMARKILENTRLRQAKRLENATAWQMGPCFGAPCRSACEGAAHSPEYRRESRRKSCPPVAICPQDGAAVPLSDVPERDSRAVKSSTHITI